MKRTWSILALTLALPAPGARAADATQALVAYCVQSLTPEKALQAPWRKEVSAEALEYGACGAVAAKDVSACGVLRQGGPAVEHCSAQAGWTLALALLARGGAQRDIAAAMEKTGQLDVGATFDEQAAAWLLTFRQRSIPGRYALAAESGALQHLLGRDQCGKVPDAAKRRECDRSAATLDAVAGGNASLCAQGDSLCAAAVLGSPACRPAADKLRTAYCTASKGVDPFASGPPKKSPPAAGGKAWPGFRKFRQPLGGGK